MSTVLLTGATGFLGGHILRALLREGHGVIILKRSTSDTSRISNELPSVASYDVDVDGLEAPFARHQIDVVIHAACNQGRRSVHIGELFEANVALGVRLLDCAVSASTPLFINTDTMLPRALNAYTVSKGQMAEWLAYMSRSIQVINLKLEHMYGPGDDDGKFVVWVLNQLVTRALEIKLTLGDQVRDFVHVNDVVAACMLLLEKAALLNRFSEFEVGTGVGTTLRDFVKTLYKSYECCYGSSRTRLRFGDVPYRDGEPMCIKVNNGPLRELGWEPKENLSEGLLEMVKAYRPKIL
jgi:CDP-paratose synthetase